jgi:hypothetical protein
MVPAAQRCFKFEGRVGPGITSGMDALPGGTGELQQLRGRTVSSEWPMPECHRSFLAPAVPCKCGAGCLGMELGQNKWKRKVDSP